MDSEAFFSNQTARVDIIKPRDQSLPWEMLVEFNREGQLSLKNVPIFNCREDSHKDKIARMLASGASAVAFGSGLYGLSANLWWNVSGKPDRSNVFFEAKSKREVFQRIPMFAPPKILPYVVEMDLIHPEFKRYLGTREKRETLWKEGAAFHLLLPVKKSNRHIHPIMITSPEDLRLAGKPPEQIPSVDTISFFWWHDRDWSDIVDMVEMYDGKGYAGISSFNEHKEPPAFNLDGVIDFVNRKGICPFDMVIQDPIGESIGVCSSHPQFKIPLKGEKAEIVVIRKGAISAEGWHKATNLSFPLKVLDSAAIAARAAEPGTILDDLVFAARDLPENDYIRRHPKKIGSLRFFF